MTAYIEVTQQERGEGLFSDATPERKVTVNIFNADNIIDAGDHAIIERDGLRPLHLVETYEQVKTLIVLAGYSVVSVTFPPEHEGGLS